MPEAVRLMELAARAGHIDATWQLGAHYAYDGFDDGESYMWCRRIFEIGEPLAAGPIGLAYMWGNGVEQDDGKAFRWLKKGADAGHRGATVYSGLMYYRGRGVERNLPEARRMLRMVAREQRYFHVRRVLADELDADAARELGLDLRALRGG